MRYKLVGWGIGKNFEYWGAELKRSTLLHQIKKHVKLDKLTSLFCTSSERVYVKINVKTSLDQASFFANSCFTRTPMICAIAFRTVLSVSLRTAFSVPCLILESQDNKLMLSYILINNCKSYCICSSAGTVCHTRNFAICLRSNTAAYWRISGFGDATISWQRPEIASGCLNASRRSAVAWRRETQKI